MAKTFATSLKIPYKGAVASYPIKYCGGARALPFYFSWRQYGTYIGSSRTTAVNPGVQFSTFVPPSQVLENVQGVFIDNTDCSSPVYLQCEDGHTVACADNATAYYPLMTGTTNFTLYIETVDGPFQRNQQTNVYLLDKPVPAFNEAQSSDRFITLSQVSGLDNFTVPIIPDFVTTANNTIVLSTTARQTQYFGFQSVASNQTVVITGIKSVVSRGYIRGNMGGVPLASMNGTLKLVSSIGTYLTAPWSAVAYVSDQAILTRQFPVIDISGFALRVRGSTNLGIEIEYGPDNQASSNDAALTFATIISYSVLTNPTV